MGLRTMLWTPSHASSQATALRLLLPPSSALRLRDTRRRSALSTMPATCYSYVPTAPHVSRVHHQESRGGLNLGICAKSHRSYFLPCASIEIRRSYPLDARDWLDRPKSRYNQHRTPTIVIDARKPSTQATCSNLSSVWCRMKRSLSILS